MPEHEKKEPAARAEEPELNDETLEEVAGGVYCTPTLDTIDFVCEPFPPTFPEGDTIA